MQVGDFVKTIDCVIPSYYGVVVEKFTNFLPDHRHGEMHVNVLLTKRTTLGHQTHWFPISQVETVNGAD